MTSSLVSKRMADIPFAGIRKVFDKAARMEAQGTRVIHFEIGRPDFDTPAHIKEAAANALARGMVHYTPNLGTLELRQALSESLRRYKNLTYDPAAELMVTAGGQQAMYLSLMAVLNPGDEVLVPDPGYGQFTTCIRLANAIPVALGLLEAENFAPDLAAAESLVNSRTRAIIVNSPHNPTGGVMTPEQVGLVCRFADRHHLLVFSDEAYDRMVYPGFEFCSPAALPESKPRTLIWGSLSKTYSMTGWRIGYIAGPPEVIAACVRLQQNMMLSVCSFAQAGAAEALRGPQDCVLEMMAEFDRRRRAVVKGIASIPGLSLAVEPRGAFYVFVRSDVAGIDSVALTDLILDKAGVATVPGPTFGNNGEGFFRISYAVSLSDCQEGIERIGRVMAEVVAGRR
jgi:aspartate/methionine/tyrosine aminotransferase